MSMATPGVERRRAKGNKIRPVMPSPSHGSSVKRLQARFLSISALQAPEKERMQRCADLVQALITKGLGQGWRVEIFGSGANEFCRTGCDLDLTVVQEDCHTEVDGPSAVYHLQERLQPLLGGHPDLAISGQVYGAKVPILKLRFENALDVDISYHNLRALRNTRLLKAYSALCPEVQELVVAVKCWAKAAGVCGAVGRNLSSYSFTLMCIYYLQVDPGVRLPCLPTSAFGYGDLGWDDPRVQAVIATWRPPNWSLCRLLEGFFHFYCADFAWGREVVSVRLGDQSRNDGSSFDMLPYRWALRIHIEDPFELVRNLHCVLAMDREGHLVNALHEGFRRTSAGMAPMGLESLWGASSEFHETISCCSPEPFPQCVDSSAPFLSHVLSSPEALLAGCLDLDVLLVGRLAPSEFLSPSEQPGTELADAPSKPVGLDHHGSGTTCEAQNDEPATWLAHCRIDGVSEHTSGGGDYTPVDERSTSSPRGASCSTASSCGGSVEVASLDPPSEVEEELLSREISQGAMAYYDTGRRSDEVDLAKAYLQSQQQIGPAENLEIPLPFKLLQELCRKE